MHGMMTSVFHHDDISTKVPSGDKAHGFVLWFYGLKWWALKGVDVNQMKALRVVDWHCNYTWFEVGLDSNYETMIMYKYTNWIDGLV